MSEDAPHDVATDDAVDELVDEPSPTPKNWRSRTLAVERLTKAELAIGMLLWPERIRDRPRTRADCANVPRPCPYVGCRHHLYLDARVSGNLQLNYPELEPWQLEQSCSLDVADAGEHTLEEIAVLMRLTRERVRQIVLIAGEQHRRVIAKHGLDALDGASSPEAPPPRVDRRRRRRVQPLGSK